MKTRLGTNPTPQGFRGRLFRSKASGDEGRTSALAGNGLIIGLLRFSEQSLGEPLAMGLKQALKSVYRNNVGTQPDTARCRASRINRFISRTALSRHTTTARATMA